MIEPEAAPPAPLSGRRRRAVVAGVTLLALVAGGIAIATGDGPEAKPLALMAGNGSAGRGESTLAARADGAPSPVAPALDARSSLPYGWGLKFEVEGPLPTLPDHAPAWTVNSPDLDRAALVRIAAALDVAGSPVQRDGGWFVEHGDWTLSAYGGDAMGKGGAWYLNLYRNRFDGAGDAAARTDPPTGPAISPADAEAKVRALLDRLGAPKATWKYETTATEIATGGWTCPSPGLSPEELSRLEAEKLRQSDPGTAGSAPSSDADRKVGAPSGSAAPTPASGATTVVDPAYPTSAASGRATSGNAGSAVGTTTPGAKPAGDGVPACTPPPAPEKGFTVALYPVLDGARGDWPVWNVTLRSDGRIENLSGSWVSFTRGADYKLRGIDAALKDLQTPPVAYATDAPAQRTAVVSDGSAGSAEGRRPLRGDVDPEPVVDLPADAVVCPPVAMPVPAGGDEAVSTMPAGCAPGAPQVVKITGVELGLIQTSVYEKGEIRLAMVPSYRFTGRYQDGGMPWETSVLALHPSAIAPPPDLPVRDDTGNGAGAGSNGAGQAVPPTPAAEPAIARDPSSR